MMDVEDRLPPRCARTFAIEREMALGGFGAVYRAQHRELDRPVALKLLHREALADAETVARFLDEARIAGALRHPHVVRVLDHDVEDGVPWIAYELIEGESLESRLARGALPWADAARMAREVASALAALHELGVVHRDVKPSNVLCAADEHFKLTDLGIARWVQQSHRTRTGMLLGTPLYLAPEAIRGEAITGAADIYALGVTLHEAIAGRPPFDAAKLDAVLSMHVEAPPPRLHADGLPRSVAELVARMLDKDPRARPEAAAVEATLAVVARGGEGPKRAPPRSRAATPAGAVVAASAFAAAGLVLLAALAWRGRAPEPAASRAAPVPVTSPTPDAADLATRRLAEAERAFGSGDLTALREVVEAVIAELGAVNAVARSIDAPPFVVDEIVLRLRETALVATRLDDEIRGFDTWRTLGYSEGTLMPGRAREHKRLYLADRRRAGRAEAIDALKARAPAALARCTRIARTLYALKLSPGQGFDASFLLDTTRQAVLLLEAVPDTKVAEVARSWLAGRPESWATHLFRAYVHHGDDQPAKRAQEVATAVALFDRTFSREDRAAREAGGKLDLHEIDALRRCAPRAAAERVRARWRARRALGPMDKGLEELDRLIDAAVLKD